MHPNRFGGVADGNAQAVGRVLLKAPPELLFHPDQKDGQAKLPGSSHRSLNIDGRASVTPHRVKGYAGPHAYPSTPEREGLGLAPPLHDLPTAIVPTGRAGAMGKPPLMTVGTFHDMRDGERVVRAPFPGAGIAMSPFRKRHRESLYEIRRLEKMLQREKSWLGYRDAALAGGVVQVNPAAGTQTAALGPTERLNREVQQDVFAQEPG